MVKSIQTHDSKEIWRQANSCENTQTSCSYRTNKIKKKKYSVTSEKYLPFTSFLIIFQTGVKYTLALYKNIIRVQSSEIHLLTGNNLKI